MSRAARRCRVCGRPVAPREANAAYPLCSARCRQVDLGRWLTDAYVISSPVHGELEAPPPPGDDEGEDGGRS